jgi:aminopeptidase-like protein
MMGIGEKMYAWAADLFPVNRSIMGQGVRDTLLYIQKNIPELTIHEVPTGTEVFDWVIPNEWNISEAYIEDAAGNRIVDFKDTNLHVVGYSIPVDLWLELEELDTHLYSIEAQPDCIPYVTSYYKERWGFCLSHNKRKSLAKGKYHVVIKSELKPGSLTYGEIILPGIETSEILLSTYICHPSMANNELSGPVVTMALTQWLKSFEGRQYTYRIVFIPETIGAIAYLSRHWQEMKKNTIAGFVLTCVGDNRAYSFMPSRLGKTFADRIAGHICRHFIPEVKNYSFLERGSDERQYCNPLIDLPVVSIMRSKYGQYPEYHTSMDNMDLISPEGLEGGFEMNRKCLEAIEINARYRTKIMGEPKMDKRGLRDTLGAPKALAADTRHIMNFLMYADGSDLLSISENIEVNIFEADAIAGILLKNDLIEKCPASEN